MDNTEDHKLQAAMDEELNKFRFLKRILQVLVSSSIFSLFLVVPIPSASQLLASLFSLLSRTLERKYMFFICNGILAFLAKKAVSSASSPSGSPDLDGQPSIYTLETVTVDEEVPMGGSEAMEEDVILVTPLAAAEEEENKGDEGQVEQKTEHVEKEDNKALIKENDGEIKDEEEEKAAFLLEQEVDEEGEEAAPQKAGDEIVGTEELNRRIEEFIRKMKAEMRIEAQQQPLIPV